MTKVDLATNTHIVEELRVQPEVKEEVEILNHIKSSDMIHITEENVILCIDVEENKKDEYAVSWKELSLFKNSKIECFWRSTIIVNVKTTQNPGLYFLYAGRAANKFFYCDTTNEEEKYDSVKSWRQLNVINETTNKTPRKLKLACAIYDGEEKVYITGGSDERSYDEWLVFNANDHTMKKLSNLNEAREGHSGCYIKGKEASMIYVFGGHNKRNLTNVQTIERLNLSEAHPKWEKIPLVQDCGLTLSIESLVIPISNHNFILLGGAESTLGASEDRKIMISIEEDDSKLETSFKAKSSPAPYWFTYNDSFNNKVLHHKVYHENYGKKFVIGKSGSFYMIKENELYEG